MTPTATEREKGGGRTRAAHPAVSEVRGPTSHGGASAHPASAMAMPEDGTRQLLKSGVWTLVTGLLAALGAKTIFGGIGIHGPHTNAGWIALLVALMCLPFGAMLFLLGAAKWLRKRRLAAGPGPTRP